MKRVDILERKEEILQWIAEELPKIEICKRLACKYETLNFYLKLMNIEYKGQQAKKGQYKGTLAYTSIDDYINNCTSIKSNDYKQKLIKFGVKKAECECCHNSVWNGQPIPLELHHIDGNHYNNAIENVQILCPNCHALCDNNSGKNVKSYRERLIRGAQVVKEDLPIQYSSKKIKKQLKHSEEQYKKLKALGKIDSMGRVSERILTEDEWNHRKDLILNSGIDLTKFGWKTKVEKITGLTRRQVCLTIEHFPDMFKEVYLR